MKKIIVISILLAMSFCVFSQNAGTDFKKMNTFYLNSGHVSIDMEYRFYENHKTAKILQTEQARYKRSGNKFYYHIDGVTTVQNNSYKLAVDEGNEVVLISKKDISENTNLFTGNLMDSVLQFCEKIDFEKTESGNKKYTLFYKNSYYIPYNKVVIELKNDNQLARIVYYYKGPINYTPDVNDVEEAPRLEIVYKNTSTAPVSTSYYSMSKYVKIGAKEVTPINKYSKYRLINQLTQKI